MPSGDPQRTWFPQMIAWLRSEWRSAMSMPMLMELRDRLNEMLHQIRRVGNIQTPVFTCPNCGLTAHASEPRVSVRAMILALARFEITSKKETRVLEKTWAEYRKKRQLDVEGKALSGPDASSVGAPGKIVRKEHAHCETAQRH